MARARRTSPVAQEAPLTNQRLRAHQENEAFPLQVKYVLLRETCYPRGPEKAGYKMKSKTNIDV